MTSHRASPHNTQAEESLLGAMLLSKDAITDGADACGADDFHKPEYGHLFHALVSIDRRGETVDVVTAEEELRRAGLSATFDALGGTPGLLDLQGNTPSLKNAGQYARIVKEHALLRRLIGVSAEIAEIGYSTPDDVEQAVERAQKLVGEVSAAACRARATLEGEDIGAVMRGEVEPIRPALLRRNDGEYLIYPGLVHALMGEPGKGKTMVALHAAAEAMAAGHAVIFLDWEGNRVTIGSRLAALGVTADQADELFIYHRPQGPITRTWVATAAATVAARGVVLVVVDSVAKSLSRQGLNEDHAPDVIGWQELLVDPLAEAGAAVLMLDHVTKDREGRGLWARGSGAKLGEISGAAWTLKPKSPFSRQRAGSADLVQAKDREGFNGADGDTVAHITFTPDHDGDHLAVRVLAPPSGATPETGGFQPTGYMERVSIALETATVPVTSMLTIRSLVSGKGEYVDQALRLLIADAHVRKDGPQYVVDKPYRAPAPEPPDGYDDDHI